MTGPISGDLAREQLLELISILGELRNAGPRDQRFKQWRQITTTLIQRIWPGEPVRAEQFRRIPFSAPTGFADRHATREKFERGCGEAATYLRGLALELGAGVPAESPGSNGPDLADAPTVDPAAPLEEPVFDDPPFRAEDLPAWATPPPAVPPRGDPPASPPPAPLPATTDPPPVAREPRPGPKARLKDMLGFGDQPPPDRAPDHPSDRAPDRAPAPPVPGAPLRTPVSFIPLSPDPIRRDPPPPVRLAPPPPPEPSRPQVPDSPAARELLALAAQVDELGVSVRERAIVRAALIDLGRQMESPPINWEALREAVALAMEHPALARRVLPLILPYLDRAA
jgi:hypothetical protein